MEKVEVKVYQMNTDKARAKGIMRFVGWETEGMKIKRLGGVGEILDALYHPVFEVHVAKELVEDARLYAGRLFIRSNMDKCIEGWNGTSMSVSDIVQVGERYLFCDDYGWVELKEG